MAVSAATGFPRVGHAQVVASVSVESDYLFRSRTLSGGRPTATLQLGYDHPSGFYFNGSATGVASRDGPELMGFQANVGYARRLSPDLSVEAGLIRADYRSSYSGGRPANYTEAYVGLTRGQVSARIYYSPHYFYDDLETLYGELDGSLHPSPKWRLSAHVGALAYVGTPSPFYGSRALRYDWRVGVSRQFGPAEIHAALSGGGPGKQYYNGRPRGLTALTAGASWSF